MVPLSDIVQSASCSSAHVVEQAERRHGPHERVQLVVPARKPILRAGMGRENERFSVPPGHGVERGHQLPQPIRVIDVFLAVDADAEVLPGRQVQPLEHVGRRDPLAVRVQHLALGRTGLDDLVRGQAFRQQVPARVLRVGQVDVADVVDDAPVDLLGHPHVEATVSGFHVEDGDLAPLGGNHRQGAVGVAQHEQRIGLMPAIAVVRPRDHPADRLRRRLARRLQEDVRLADTQFVEEDPVELVVVVLPRVNKDVLRVLVQTRDHARQLDDLRAGTQYRHDLHASDPRSAASGIPAGDTPQRAYGVGSAASSSTSTGQGGAS